MSDTAQSISPETAHAPVSKNINSSPHELFQTQPTKTSTDMASITKTLTFRPQPHSKQTSSPTWIGTVYYQTVIKSRGSHSREIGSLLSAARARDGRREWPPVPTLNPETLKEILQLQKETPYNKEGEISRATQYYDPKNKTFHKYYAEPIARAELE